MYRFKAKKLVTLNLTMIKRLQKSLDSSSVPQRKTTAFDAERRRKNKEKENKEKEKKRKKERKKRNEGNKKETNEIKRKKMETKRKQIEPKKVKATEIQR